MKSTLLFLSFAIFFGACKSKPATELAGDGSITKMVPVYDKSGNKIGQAQVDLGTATNIKELKSVNVTYNEKMISLSTDEGEKGMQDPVTGEGSGQTKYFTDNWATPNVVLSIQFELFTDKIKDVVALIVYNDPSQANAANATPRYKVQVFAMKAGAAPTEMGEAALYFTGTTINEVQKVTAKYGNNQTVELALVSPDPTTDPIEEERTGQTYYYVDAMKTHVVGINFRLGPQTVQSASELRVYAK